MMYDLMPVISEDGDQAKDSITAEDENYEKLMLTMLDERERLTEDLRVTQLKLGEALAKLREVERERNSLSERIDSIIGKESFDLRQVEQYLEAFEGIDPCYSRVKLGLKSLLGSLSNRNWMVAEEFIRLTKELESSKDKLIERDEEVSELKAERSNTKLLLEHLECLVSRHERALRTTVVKRQTAAQGGVSSEVEVLKALKSLFEHHKALDEKVRDRLKQALEHGKSMEDDLTSSLYEIEKLRLENQKLVQQIATMTLASEQMKNSSWSASSATSESSSEIRQLRITLEYKDREIEKVRRECRQLKDHTSLLEDQLAMSAQHLDQVQESSARLQDACDQAGRAQVDAEKQLRSLESRFSIAQRDLKLMKEEKDWLNVEKDSYISTICQQEKRISALVTELASFKKTPVDPSSVSVGSEGESNSTANRPDVTTSAIQVMNDETPTALASKQNGNSTGLPPPSFQMFEHVEIQERLLRQIEEYRITAEELEQKRQVLEADLEESRKECVQLRLQVAASMPNTSTQGEGASKTSIYIQRNLEKINKELQWLQMDCLGSETADNLTVGTHSSTSTDSSLSQSNSAGGSSTVTPRESDIYPSTKPVTSPEVKRRHKFAGLGANHSLPFTSFDLMDKRPLSLKSPYDDLDSVLKSVPRPTPSWGSTYSSEVDANSIRDTSLSMGRSSSIDDGRHSHRLTAEGTEAGTSTARKPTLRHSLKQLLFSGRAKPAVSPRTNQQLATTSKSSSAASPISDMDSGSKWTLMEAMVLEDRPFNTWSLPALFSWLEVWLCLPEWYISACRTNIKSAAIMSALSDQEIQAELGVQNPLHRMKLQLAVQAMNKLLSASVPASSKLQRLQHNPTHLWIANDWLTSLGLPQYKDVFLEHLVDTRMLPHLTSKEFRRHLKIVDSFHRASISWAISCLDMLDTNHLELERRRIESEGADKDVIVWSNVRVTEWVRSIGLREYAGNLAGTGVHGAVIALDNNFTADMLALHLRIPLLNTHARQHLTSQFTQLLNLCPDRYIPEKGPVTQFKRSKSWISHPVSRQGQDRTSNASASATKMA